jgi:hypothetical protein
MEKLKKIPKGEYKNVRFDIDYGNSISDGVCNDQAGGNSTCYCPAGSYITTMAAFYIGLCMSDCDANYSNSGGICWGQCQGSAGCYSVGPCCWYTDFLHLPSACHHPECVSSYIPSSFEWGSSAGYFCNSAGQIGASANAPSCPVVGDYYPTCWNASNNNQSCCIPNLTVSEASADPFTSMCCPPGSSC